MATPPIDNKLETLRREAEERDAERRALRLGLRYINLGTSPIQIDALKLVPRDEARALKVVSFEAKHGLVALGVFDPALPGIKQLVDRLSAAGYVVKLFVVSEGGLAHAWDYYRFVTTPIVSTEGELTVTSEEFSKKFSKLGTLEAVRKAVNSFHFSSSGTSELIELILEGALQNRASDIHFEAEEKDIRLRYRIDGSLYDVLHLATKQYSYILSRIKLLAHAKLNVSSEPQDGRFSLEVAGKEVEFRVSFIPSQFGETVVMRALDPATLKTKLTDIGFRPDDLAIVETELKRPNGMILNTGPTGSGKTTTLYAFLLSVRTPEIKIITIEDPIEYELSGIEQTQVDAAGHYTFAEGLRSIMRQDPDVILVGEVRDKDTAEIALQAALTGHLVFSTVHANSAAGAVPRLVDLGVKAETISSGLNLIIAQRLVRKLCEKCRVPAKIASDQEQKFRSLLGKLPKRVRIDDYVKPTLYGAKGCEACTNTGYLGRIAIFELIPLDDDFRDLIKKSSDLGSVEKKAREKGMVSMQEDGILRVLLGVTTFEEVEATTGPLQWG